MDTLTHWPEAGGHARHTVPAWVRQDAPSVPLSQIALSPLRPDRWAALHMGWPVSWSRWGCPLCAGDRPSGAWRYVKDGRCATCT